MKTIEELMHNGSSLREILNLHKRWVYGEEGGVKADLSGANMSEADLSGANMSEADLRGSDLRGADLSGADLSGANMSEADLSGANMSEADLSGADLSGANMSEADLSGSDLRWSDLRGAKYEYEGVKAKRFSVFNNLYKYVVIPILSVDNIQYVRMGCKFYSRKDWEAGKGANNGEFPNDGSEKSELRKFALATAFAWLDLVEKQEAK